MRSILYILSFTNEKFSFRKILALLISADEETQELPQLGGSGVRALDYCLFLKRSRV